MWNVRVLVMGERVRFGEECQVSLSAWLTRARRSPENAVTAFAVTEGHELAVEVMARVTVPEVDLLIDFAFFDLHRHVERTGSASRQLVGIEICERHPVWWPLEHKCLDPSFVRLSAWLQHMDVREPPTEVPSPLLCTAGRCGTFFFPWSVLSWATQPGDVVCTR